MRRWGTTIWQPQLVVMANPGFGVDEPAVDPLSLLSDTFPGASLSPDWLIYEGGGNVTTTVTLGALLLDIDAGNTTGSFWYNEFEGILVYKLITGNFDMVADAVVHNTTRTGLPPVTSYRLAGIAAHDPSRTLKNYVHVAFGATAQATLQCEWKTTVDSTSFFNSINWPTAAGQLRLTRVGQVFTAYARLTSSDAWTTVQVMDRAANPMPATLQVGMMVYSLETAHDISVDFAGVTFSTP